MIIKSSIQVTAFTVITIILNFLVQLVVAYYFGAKIERDAYFAAVAIPTYLSTVFLGSIGVIFLPKLIKIYLSNKKLDRDFINNTLSNSLTLLFVLSILGIIFSRSILRITAPGFSNEELSIATPLLQILFPTIVFQGGASILSSIYQSNNRFIIPSAAPVVGIAISLISVLLLSKSMGIKSLAVGTTIGSIVTFSILFPILDRFRFTFNLMNREFLYLLGLSAPLFLSGIISRSVTVFERMIASSLPEGSISYLGYANQIMTILSAIAVGGISTAIFPVLSKSWAEGDVKNVINYFSKGIRLILYITVPISFYFFIQGEDLIKFIFERGEFDNHTTVAVVQTFLFLSLAFVSNSVGSIISKVFYLSERTQLSSFFEVLVTLVYAGMAFVLIKYFSYLGLAMASSIGAFLSIAVSTILVYRILKGVELSFIFQGFAKITVSALLSSIITWQVICLLPKNLDLVLKVGFCGVTYLIEYIILTALLRLEETQKLVCFVTSKFKN